MHCWMNVCLAWVMLIAIGGELSAQTSKTEKSEPQEVELAESESPRHKLLKQRHNIAVQEFRLARNQYRSGTSPMEVMLTAALHVGESKVLLANNTQERIAGYEEMLRLQQEVEDVATARFQGGAGTQLEVMRAKYGRLGAELKLLDARAENAK